jgi:hypothetical protein
MRNVFLTLFVFVATLFCCHAQKIEPQKVFGGYNFSVNGQNLKMGELVDMMQPNPAASQLISTAQSQNTISSILAYLGGGLVGWEIGNLITGKKMNLAVGGSGVALICIALPVGSAAEKNTLKAVDLYNSGLKTTFLKDKPTLNLVSRGNGVGLVMTF